MSLTVRTLEHVKPMVGDTVAIIGPGSIGMFHLQAFKAAGASKIIVIHLGPRSDAVQNSQEIGRG